MTTATTWRDLAGQLTAGQVQHLTRREELLRRRSRHRKDDAEIDADLLGDARGHIEGNERDQRFAHIPEPAGAVFCWHWDSPELTGAADWRREIEGREWSFGDGGLERGRISIGGWQYADGTVTYWVDIEANCQLTAAQAGDVAAAMTEAAAELARLSAVEATVTR